MTMSQTVSRGLAGLANKRDANALRPALKAAEAAFKNVALSSAGLVIKAGGSALAKTGAAIFYASVGGTIVSIAAGTDMPALTGLNIAQNKYNVICFFIDAAGTVTASLGTPGDTPAEVVFPAFSATKTLVGYLLITHSSAFTGGTTALDTATTVYVSPMGAFNPTI